MRRQSAERVGSGLQAALQQQKAPRAGCTCAGAAHKCVSLILCCGGFLVPVSPALRDEARRVEVQYRAQPEAKTP